MACLQIRWSYVVGVDAHRDEHFLVVVVAPAVRHYGRSRSPIAVEDAVVQARQLLQDAPW
jgi:hypothetical protein